MTNPSYTDEQVLKCAKTYEGYGEPVCPAMLRSLLADRQRLLAEVESLRGDLRGKADKAYCDYIRQMSRTECLGWEAKVRAGRFTEKELAAHTHAGELLGRHRALHEAAQALPSATPNETKEAKS